MKALQTMKIAFFILLSLMTSSARGQVEYSSNEKPGDPLGNPWRIVAKRGIDEKTGGWFYNLGITGIRVQFYADHQKELLVKYVFAGSPADGIISAGDWIIGADQKNFQYDHWNDYDFLNWGASGEQSPLGEFAAALEKAQSASSNGIISIRVRKPDGRVMDRQVEVGKKYGSYSPTFPINCPKSSLIRKELVQDLVRRLGSGGRFSYQECHNLAAMALLSDGSPESLGAAERVARDIAHTTGPIIRGNNWNHTQGGIYLAEYYLATGEEWVLPQLVEIRDALLASQYRPTSTSDKPPTGAGGWSHREGYYGYGPIGIISAQATLSLALIRRCGIEVDEDGFQAAMGYLDRTTNVFRLSSRAPRGKRIVYKEGSGNFNIGPTGAAALIYLVSAPFDQSYAETGQLHSFGCSLMKGHFPDNHGSSTMGMGYSSAGTFANDQEDFRALMDHNKWWFTLAQTFEGSIYLQPGLEPSKFLGETSRFTATASTAFILSLPRGNLVVSGSLKEYDKWATQYPTANLIAPRADFDQDGMSNFDEFLENRDPTVSETFIELSSYDLESNSLSYTRSDMDGQPMVYTLWSSDDLENWTQEASAVHKVIEVDANGVETVTVQLPSANGLKKFYRIGASENQ